MDLELNTGSIAPVCPAVLEAHDESSSQWGHAVSRFVGGKHSADKLLAFLTARPVGVSIPALLWPLEPRRSSALLEPAEYAEVC